MLRRSRRLPAAIFLVLISLAVVVGGAVATGRVSFVRTNGVSMNPVYHEGDLVVVARASSYEVGDIVAYHTQGTPIVVLHRIVGGDAAGFIVKGDNNESADSGRPTASQIIGHAVVHLPEGGVWFGRFTSPAAVVLFAIALAAGSGTAVHVKRRRRRTSVPVPASRGNLPLSSVFNQSRPRQIAAVAIAAAALFGVALGALAFRASSQEEVNGSTPVDRDVTFSYTATVPPSAAYDGTTARSPDAIFRKLTNTVDVQLAYHGSPGVLTVDALVASSGGWHSTVPLAAAATINGADYVSTVRLDLNDFDARAAAASAATGVAAGPLTVTIVARIEAPGFPVFTPMLKLSVTPLELVLVGGDPTSLIVHNSSTVPKTTHTPNMLVLFGQSMTVTQARTISAILLLLAIEAAAVLAFIHRRSPPVSQGAAIERRYSSMLAAVHPITSPANRPVVEVAEFETLVKLAERCGLLVLHWSRADIATFVVLDERTTYRYRTGVGADFVAEPYSLSDPEPLPAAVRRAVTPVPGQHLDSGFIAEPNSPPSDPEPLPPAVRRAVTPPAAQQLPPLRTRDQ